MRRLLAITATWEEGRFTITGDKDDDALRLVVDAESQAIVLTDWSQSTKLWDGAALGASVDQLTSLVVSLGDGNDSIDLTQLAHAKGFSDALRGAVVVDLGPGDDEASLGWIGGTLRGGEGDDRLFGGHGNDVLEGGPGDDYLSGGLGDDVYEFVGAELGSDTIDEPPAEGQDTLDFGQFGGSVTLRLWDARPQSYAEDGRSQLTLTNGTGVEVVVGSAWPDVIEGNSRENTLVGGPGDDVLDGREAFDRYVFYSGDIGSDTLADAAPGGNWIDLSGLGAPATLDLRSADVQHVTDRLSLQLKEPSAFTWVTGTAFNDRLIGNEMANRLDGGPGADELRGGEGNDELFGGDGDDLLDGGPGFDHVDGAAGVDRIFGDASEDRIVGGGDADFLNDVPWNDVPRALDDRYEVHEDTTLVVDADFGVGANDWERDSGGQTLSVVTWPRGNVELRADGSFTYVPPSDFFGQDEFVYRLTDGDGAAAEAKVVIDVLSVNDPPVLRGFPATVAAQAGKWAPLVLGVIEDDAPPHLQLTVEVSVGKGALRAPGAVGANRVSGDGTNTLRIRGSLLELNHLLDTGGIEFRPAADAISDQLSIIVHDEGASGADAVSMVRSNVAISIAAAEGVEVARSAFDEASRSEWSSRLGHGAIAEGVARLTGDGQNALAIDLPWDPRTASGEPALRVSADVDFTGDDATTAAGVLIAFDQQWLVAALERRSNSVRVVVLDRDLKTGETSVFGQGNWIYDGPARGRVGLQIYGSQVYGALNGIPYVDLAWKPTEPRSVGIWSHREAGPLDREAPQWADPGVSGSNDATAGAEFDDFAAINLGEPSAGSAAGAESVTALPFHDTFDASPPVAGWTFESTTLTDGLARFNDNTYSLLTRSVTHENVAVQGFVSTVRNPAPVDAGPSHELRAGLVVRHAKNGGNHSLFWGGILRARDGRFEARIDKIVQSGGSWIVTNVANAPLPQGEGFLRFEAVGSTFKLFLENQLIVNGALAGLSDQTGVGLLGFRAGGTVDSFSAWAMDSSGYPAANLVHRRLGDFDGDGVQDEVGHFNGEGSGADEDVWLVQGAGLGTTAPHAYLRYAGAWPANLQQSIVVGDFNGDGRDDLAGHDGVNWRLLQSEGDRFRTAVSLGAIPMQGGAFRWSEVVAGDINGDGRDEILGLNRHPNPDVWEMHATNGNAWTTSALGSWSGVWPDNIQTVVGDFNGDGSDDLAAQDVNNDWRLLTSIGAALYESAFVPDGVRRTGLYVLDYDGDGGDEILAPGTAMIGIDFVSGKFTGVPLAPNSKFFVGDVNQDGRGDLLQESSGNWVAHSWLGATPTYGARVVPLTAFRIHWWSWLGLGAARFADVEGPMRAATAAFADVRNNVEYQLYPGYLKGPAATRQTQAGNHWDQAALLKQELEGLGLVVLYAWGTISPNANALRNWIGASDDGSAIEMLRQAKLYNSASTIQHAWIKSFLPAVAGDMFLALRDLDPSWKQKNRQDGRSSALQDLPYDAATWNAASVRKSYLLPQDADEFNAVSTLLPFEYYEDRLQDWLKDHVAPDQRLSLADVPFDGPIIAEYVDALPLALDYQVNSADGGTAVPNHVVQRIAIGGAGLWSPVVITTAASALNSFFIEYASGKVRLRQAGNVAPLAESPPIAASAAVQIEFRHFDVDETNGAGPTAPTRINTYPRKAGEYHALGINALQHSPESLRALRAKADQAVAGFWNDPSPPGDPGADPVAAAMNLAMAKYYYDLDEAARIISGLTHKQIVLQGVGTGLASSRGKSEPSKPAVEYEFEKRVQVPLVPLALSIDTKGNLASAVARQGATPASWFSIQAYAMLTDTASALEHETLEELFNIDAMSTVKGLQRARAFGGSQAVKIWSGGSVTTFLADINLSAALESELQADLSQSGARALVLTNEISLAATNPQDPYDWLGGVFLLENFAIANPVSKHRIDGGFKGGFGRMSSTPVVPPGSKGQHSVYGDPVNVANGAVYRDETDLVLPNIGVPLEFSRHYESLNSYDPADANSGLDVGLGQGWTHSFSDFLTIVNPGGAEQVTWTDSKGQKHTFTQSGGGYANPPELFGKLTKQSGNDYTYEHEDGTKRYFTKIGGTTPADRGPVLIRIADRFDRGVRADYSGGMLRSVSEWIGPSGSGNSARRIDFVYGPNDPDHISEVQEFAGAGRKWNYKYVVMTPPGASSAKRYLSSVALPDDPDRHNERFSARPLVQYAYYEGGSRIHGLLKQIIEPNGGAHDYTYYVNRRSFEVTDAEGHTTYGAYNLYTQATTFYNERGFAETYEYDANGLLERHTYPDRSRDRFEWSGFRMTRWTDAFGFSEVYTYEGASNRLDTSTDRLGLVTSYDWNSTYPALPASQTRPGGRITTYVYADNGRKLDYVQVVADGGASETLTTDYSINSEGLVATLFTPRGVPPTGTVGTDSDFHTSYSYHVAGLPTIESRGGGFTPATVAYTYDALGAAARTRGFLLTATDADGVVTTNTYDAIGRLKDTSLPDPFGVNGPPTTSYVYDAWGLLYKEWDNLGTKDRPRLQHDYDRKGRLIRTTYADGTFVQFVYDPVGNLVAETDELGRVTRHIYDARNRRVQTLYADGASVGMLYDAEGMLVRSVDERGYASTRQYDRGGRLTKETSPDPARLPNLLPTPPPGQPADFYTPADPPPLTTRYFYETNTERLQKVVDPRGAETTYVYDKADRLIRENLTADGQLQLVTFYDYDRDSNVERVRRYDVRGVAPPSDWLTWGAQNPTKYRFVQTTFDNFNRPELVSETWGLSGDPFEYRRSNTDYTLAGRITISQTHGQYAAGASVAATFHYDDTGRLMVLSRPNPLVLGPRPDVKTFYDEAGNVERVETLRAPGNYDTTFTRRDARYRAVHVTEDFGDLNAVTQTLFDVAGQLVATIDPLGRMTYHRYDARGRLVRRDDPDPDGALGNLRSPVTLFTYDAAGNLVAQRDAEGRLTQYVYDELNRRVKTRLPDPDGAGPLPVLEEWTYYDAGGAVALSLTVKNVGGTITPKPGFGTRLTYDQRGQLTDRKEPDPDAGAALPRPQTSYAYNGFGELTSETQVSASSAHITSYTYYRTGWLHTITAAVPNDGEVAPREERVYDPDGNLHQTRTRVDASSERDLVTVHDLFGRVYRREESAADQFGANSQNPITLYSYDYVGNLLITERYVTAGLQSLAGRLETEWRGVDALGRVVWTLVNDPDGTPGNRPYTGYVVGAGEELFTPAEYFDYDLAGQRWSVKDAAEHTTQSTYDQLGRVIVETQVSGGLTRTFEYDRVGNLTKAVQRDGRWIEYQYDAWNRLVLETWRTAGGVLQHTIATAYDEWGRRQSITETDAAAGEVYQHFVSNLAWEYDHLDRVTKETNTTPVAGTEQTRFEYVYNAAGDRATILERNLVGAVWQNASVTTLTYDRLHRLRAEEVNPGGWSLHTRRKRAELDYNAVGELTALRRAEWNGAARVDFPETTWQYDVWGRTSKIETAPVSGQSQAASTHDLIWTRGGRLSYWDNYGPQTVELEQLLDYDFRGQLLRSTANFGGASGSWQYDAAGSRRDNDPGSYHAYDVGPYNRQATSPQWVLTWDAEGRLSQRFRRNPDGSPGTLESAYAWDQRGRLLKVVEYAANGTTVVETGHFAYDALDRRARQTVVGGTHAVDERYVYESGELALVYDLLGGGGATAREKLRERYLNARGVDLVLSVEPLTHSASGANTAAGQASWYLHDHLGTPRDTLRRSSTSPATVQHWQQFRYDAWGRSQGVFAVTTGAPTTPPRIGFTGQVFDVATGLNYYQARYYDPDLGRFLSEDPAGFAAGELNLYRYVGNEPTRLVDPTGRNPARPYELSPNPRRIGSDAPHFANALGYQGSGTGTDRNVLDAVSGLGGVAGRLLGSWVQPGFDRYYAQLESSFDADYARSGSVDFATATRAERQYRAAHPWIASVGDMFGVGIDTAQGAGRGLMTGGKAVVNATADTLVSTATLGYYDNVQLVGVTQQDLLNGYNASYGFARVGSEILVGVATGTAAGSLAKGGQLAQYGARGLTAFDTVGQTLGMARAGQEIAAEGLSVGNGLTFAGNALGLGAQLKSGGIDAIAAGMPGPVHGNSLEYVGNTHVYAIRGPDGVHKIGQSMKGVRATDGASIRGEAQARALARQTGQQFYSEILRVFPEKRLAMEYETQLIQRFRHLWGVHTLPGNKTNH